MKEFKIRREQFEEYMYHTGFAETIIDAIEKNGPCFRTENFLISYYGDVVSIHSRGCHRDPFIHCVTWKKLRHIGNEITIVGFKSANGLDIFMKLLYAELKLLERWNDK